ncbi:glutathione S-transferase P 1-like [Gigantopelta aegis]|uniref:glutathione S-transferase P 1-like n=1 Tax=Gigantopelta aegis TaxID=1735272 RepID=UPI001B88776A|nr:glutathione S-transferase P 1-like [Gigantopelta aegis]
MSGYELIYFPVKGRGQSIRYLFHDNDLQFTETNCGEDFNTKWKPKMVFGQVPCLKDGTFDIVQSNAILRHLGRKHGLYGSNENEATRIDVMNDGVEDIRGAYVTMIYTNYEKGKDAFVQSLPNKLGPFEKLLAADAESKNGFAVGGKVSFMDYNLVDLLDILQVLSPGCLDKFPAVKAYFGAFLKRPGIQKARNTDQFKNMPINANGKQ